MQTAKNLLNDHLQTVGLLKQRAQQLRIKINEANAEVTEAQSGEVESLRNRRREMLGECYRELRPYTDVDQLDAQILKAEALARVAGVRAEAASAAVEQLEGQYQKLAAEIAELSKLTPALMYQAHVEHATQAIDGYHAAHQALAAAHATLQGRLLAADQYADLHAAPARTFCIGVAGVVREFEAGALPNLPAVDQYDWRFDMSGMIAAEQQRARNEIGG